MTKKEDKKIKTMKRERRHTIAKKANEKGTLELE